MRPRIHAFGSRGLVPFFIAEGDTERQARVARELWFDRDIDGRWLVCAVKPDHPATQGHDDAHNLGAIVITDPQAIAFIELLGELVADPAQFGHEPAFASFSEDDRE